MTVICDGSEQCATSTINFVGDTINQLLRDADKLKDDAVEALADLQAHAKENMSLIMGVADYNADVSDVPMDFQPYTGTAPTEPDFSDLVPAPPEMPDADEPLITPCEIDAIYTRAKAKITKVNRKATHDAYYGASRAGIGMAATTLNMAVKQANYENNSRTVEASLEHAANEGQWRREDRKAILELQASIYQSSSNGAAAYLNAETQRFLARQEMVKTHLQSEAERRGWSEMELRTILEMADKVSLYAMEKVKALIAALDSADQAIAQLLVQLAQGLYSAADVGLSGSGSYSGSASESYTYSGEIAT